MSATYAVHACPHCGNPTTRRKHCSTCAGVRYQPDALVHATSGYSDDPAAQMIASMGGATLDLIGAAMGVSRERIRQIEADALRRLVKRCQLAGIDREDIAAILASRESDAPPPSQARAERIKEKRRNGEWSKGRGANERSPHAVMRNLDGTHHCGVRLDRELLAPMFYSEHGQRCEKALAEAEAKTASAAATVAAALTLVDLATEAA